MYIVFIVIFVCVIQAQELEDSEGGDFLFFSKNNEVAEEAHLLGKGTSDSKPLCEDSILSSDLASIQVINPESVIALAAKNKLENKCHNISKTIDHMESYLKSCSLASGQEEYLHLLNAVKALHKKLCTKDPYHKSFMQHKKCFEELQSEVGDSCNGPADWSECSIKQRVCRAYQEIRDCYYLKASVMCGEPAALVFKELVQCIIESVITVDCPEVAAKSKEEQQMLKSQQKAATAQHGRATASSHISRLTGLFIVFSTHYLLSGKIGELI